MRLTDSAHATWRPPRQLRRGGRQSPEGPDATCGPTPSANEMAAWRTPGTRTGQSRPPRTGDNASRHHGRRPAQGPSRCERTSTRSGQLRPRRRHVKGLRAKRTDSWPPRLRLADEPSARRTRTCIERYRGKPRAQTPARRRTRTAIRDELLRVQDGAGGRPRAGDVRTPRRDELSTVYERSRGRMRCSVEGRRDRGTASAQRGRR